jgi:hypothetical protein
MRDIPFERYAGRVAVPFAVYRLPGSARGFDAAFVGVAHAQGAQTYPVGGPGVPQAQANEPGNMIPFTRATTPRAQAQDTTGPTVQTAAQQNIEITMQGSGYAYGMDIDVNLVTSANAAVVAFTEDGPWSVLASIIFKDVQGELVNLDGFSLRLANLYCGYRTTREDVTGGTAASTDTQVFQAVTGAGGTGGSIRLHLWLPIATNRRDLIGVLGNQDRAMRYQLRTDLAPSASVYATPPTALGSATIRRTYHSLTVPDPENGNKAKQEREPAKFGILHFTTKNRNVGIPSGGSTVNHPLARLGNTIRVIILVLRSNGSRATAEANMPTLITFKFGDIPIFSETPAARRMTMFNRYGFDAPAGVYVYDAITDFILSAGAELGEDFWWTNGLVNAQFEIAYPAGFGAANNSLDVITDDLQIPDDVDFYASA